MITFKQFFEGMDIFGFENKPPAHTPESDTNPIRGFDLELMMKYLLGKKVGLQEADYSGFMNEISWGNRPGSVKLEVDTGMTFFIKRLGTDLEGQNRWVTKKMFQLNRRNGMAGYEDMIANEIYTHISKIGTEGEVDRPMREFRDTERLTWHIADVMKRTAKPVFIWKGIKKLDEQVFQILFEVRGQGLEAPDQQRIENNVTQVSFLENEGVIRLMNYNIESAVGGDRSWTQKPLDLDVYFFPTQTKEEIGNCMAVHFKYY